MPPEALLEQLAAALNACERAGLKPRLRRDVVLTRAGWVLPPCDTGQQWVARFPSAPPVNDLEPSDPDDMD